MKTSQNGFLLIALVIVIAIVAIMAAVYFKGSGDESSSAFKAGQKGLEDARQNKEIMESQQLEIQNQLNSIDK